MEFQRKTELTETKSKIQNRKSSLKLMEPPLHKNKSLNCHKDTFSLNY